MGQNAQDHPEVHPEAFQPMPIVHIYAHGKKRIGQGVSACRNRHDKRQKRQPQYQTHQNAQG